MDSSSTTQAPPDSNDLELLSLLLSQHEASESERPTITKRADPARAPLSFGQQRLWFIHQLEPAHNAYNISAAFELEGRLLIEQLSATLQVVIERHESLRTCFISEENEPIQQVLEQVEVPLTVLDISKQAACQQRETVRAHIEQASGRAFDLAKAPLFHVTALTLNEHQWTLVFTIHHIISDGWSMSQLVSEVAALWNATTLGQQADLKELPVQYGDFAQWQRAHEHTPDFQNKLTYWTQNLAHLPALNLPTNYPRPPIQTFEGALCHFEISTAVTRQLNQLAQETGSTLFMILLSAYSILLQRYSGEKDFAIGTPDANRTRQELEPLIGFFVNTLVLRTRHTGTPSFKEFLETIKETTLDAYAHQEVPFEKIVETLNPLRDLSQTPLVDVTFTLNSPLEERLTMPGLALTPIEPENTVAKYSLSLATWEKGDVLKGFFQYNKALFKPSHIEKLKLDYIGILQHVAQNPDSIVSNIPLVTCSQQTLAANVQKSVSVPQRFSQVIETHSDKFAIETHKHTLTFCDLDAQANAIAYQLKATNIQAESNIVVCLQRDAQWIATLWAVWKIGCTFVSIDVETPLARLDYILNDTKAQALVTTEEIVHHHPNTFKTSVLTVESFDEPRDDCPSLLSTDMRKPAYIIYTSGSTGTAKGVSVSHQALANLTDWHIANFAIESKDKATQVASPAFDASIWEVWPHLCAGATLHIIDKATLIDLPKLQNTLIDQAITISFLPTPVAAELINTTWPQETSLRYLLTGGDRLPAMPSNELPFTLVNNYGPTENAVVATSAKLETSPSSKAPPIGQAVHQVETYVLDDGFNPVPDGTPGELYLGGSSLATGYVNKPEETASHFLPHPFSQEIGTRLYKTGDRVLRDEHGILHFIGRRDHQHSIRGYRVELGEIESVLKKQPQVEEAVVITDSHERLIAFIKTIGDHKSATLSIKEALRTTLPAYMLPERYRILDKFPLTLNGKIDRQQLLTLSETATHAAEQETPDGELEIAIAETWKQLLSLNTVSRNDDFFALGGHSMLAAHVLLELQSRTNVDIPMRLIFEAPKLCDLARAIEQLPAASVASYFAELPAAFLEAEAARAKQLIPDTLPPVAQNQSPNILLTGATGFLGALLCRELIAAHNGALKLYCLVRSDSKQAGLERLKSIFKQYALWQDGWETVIEVVPGDLAQPLLGLDEATFEMLCKEITHIYHNGAQVHFIHPYEKLKPANVQGTEVILRLASMTRLKPISYISSLSVLGSSISERTEQDPLTVPAGLGNGYAQSKWVAEKMMHHAKARGIPITIHRPARIIGDTEHGIWNPDDFACRMIQGCVQLGLVPTVQGYDNMVPVDAVARAIVLLDQTNETSPYYVYHLNHPEPISWQRFIDETRKRGYALESVSYSEWRHALHEHIHRGQPNALSELLGMFPPDETEVIDAPWEPQETVLETIHNEQTIEQLKQSGFAFEPINEQLLAKYFDFFEQSELLTK